MDSPQAAAPQVATPQVATPQVATLQVATLQVATFRTVSPLVIADRLISLAQDADRAGYRDTAAHIVSLVYSVLEQRAAH